jgi:hypothetical protein
VRAIVATRTALSGTEPAEGVRLSQDSARDRLSGFRDCVFVPRGAAKVPIQAVRGALQPHPSPGHPANPRPNTVGYHNCVITHGFSILSPETGKYIPVPISFAERNLWL